MEQLTILRVLQLPLDMPIYIKSMVWVMWGRDLHFACIAGEAAFGLHFKECRETRWQIYTHQQDPDNPAFPQTELVNFKQGRDQHRSPAHLLTEHFGVSLVYGALELHVNDSTHNLGN